MEATFIKNSSFSVVLARDVVLDVLDVLGRSSSAGRISTSTARQVAPQRGADHDRSSACATGLRVTVAGSRSVQHEPICIFFVYSAFVALAWSTSRAALVGKCCGAGRIVQRCARVGCSRAPSAACASGAAPLLEHGTQLRLLGLGVDLCQRAQHCGKYHFQGCEKSRSNFFNKFNQYVSMHQAHVSRG